MTLLRPIRAGWAWFARKPLYARIVFVLVAILVVPLGQMTWVEWRIGQELAATPEIVCVKEETGDIRRVSDLYIALGDRFSIFCGVDDLIVESMALGVTGWVSGMTNAWPAECVELFELCAGGKFAEARELYHILTPAFHLDTHVKLVQYIKLAENLVYGAPEWTRPPRLPLVGEERAMVVRTVKAAIAALEKRAAKA